MIKVAPLRYDVIFKKAFGNVQLFKALVEDFLGIENLKIEKVENDKAFYPAVGNVGLKYDLFAEDQENRVVVEVQHAHRSDTFERFLYYHLCAMVESIKSSKNYSFPVTVMTLVFFTEKMTPLTSNGILTLPFVLRGEETGKEINLFGKPHKLQFVFTTYYSGSDDKPQEWMKAINASMGGTVYEDDYENQNILKMFEIIKEDNITPEERAQMKEEDNIMEDIEKSFEKGLEKGLEKGREEGLEKGREEGLEKGREEGLEKGREEGLEKGQENTARNLLALGTLSLEEIASATNLTVERIKALGATDQKSV